MYELMWGMWSHSHAWFWPGAPFAMILGVALIVLGLWVLLGNAPRGERVGPNRAREILDVRYAAGELTTAEYEERLEHLRHGVGPSSS
jgi:putative membrane protein